jgi:hypothetical protein
MSETLAGLYICLLIGLLAAVGAWGVTHSLWKADTVQRGLAMYCPDNGQWAWNGECEK